MFFKQVLVFHYYWALSVPVGKKKFFPDGRISFHLPIQHPCRQTHLYKTMGDEQAIVSLARLLVLLPRAVTICEGPLTGLTSHPKQSQTGTGKYLK